MISGTSLVFVSGAEVTIGEDTAETESGVDVAEAAFGVGVSEAGAGVLLLVGEVIAVGG